MKIKTCSVLVTSVFLCTVFASTSSHASPFRVNRYTTAGSLDTAFSSDGKASYELSNYLYEFGRTMAQVSSTRYLMVSDANRSTSPFTSAIVGVKLTDTGAVDTTFGSSGYLIHEWGGAAQITVNGMQIDGNGKVVVCGSSRADANATEQVFVARYNSNGTIDTSFGSSSTPGRRTYTPSRPMDANDCTILSDNSIVVGGSMWFSSTSDNRFALVKFTSSGSLATSFGSNGEVVSDFSSRDNEEIYELATDSNGRIVGAGYAAESLATPSFEFAVARWDPSSGGLDTSFDGDGKVLVKFSTTNVTGTAVTTIGNEIVVAGNGGNGDLAFARLNENGSLDTTFDGDGKVLVTVSGYDRSHVNQIRYRNQELATIGRVCDGPNIGDCDGVMVKLKSSTGARITAFSSDGVRTSTSGAFYSGVLDGSGRIYSGY